MYMQDSGQATGVNDGGLVDHPKNNEGFIPL